jgi:crotonobetainyl-CoA:carnitine CoA-transferase CaiB-like acyl-CoA transferase
MNARPLDDLQVLDLSTEIAGPYCTKLFADAGADVIKVEPPGGDPLRRFAAAGESPDGNDGALFRYLHAGKRSVTAASDDLLAGADVLVEDGLDLDIDELRRRHPHLVVVSITWYGRTGPNAGFPGSDFTIQCDSGAMKFRVPPDRPPVQAGGRISEFMAGAFAAAPALAAVLRARAGGPGEHVDVSIHDVMIVAGSNYTPVLHDLLGRPPFDGIDAINDTPGIEQAKDGLVGFSTNSGQMFQMFLLMIERPELMGDPTYASLRARTALGDEWQGLIDGWVGSHTVDEIIELAGALRVPVAPVHDGASIANDEQLVARGAIRPGPDGQLEPQPPYRINGHHFVRACPAPGLGEHDSQVVPRTPRPQPSRAPALPLAGVRVLDLTSWWVGALATQGLAVLGADVVHIESTTHPDGMRLTGHSIARSPEWWEWGHMFTAANAGKRSITLDLASNEGAELLRRLISVADVLVENFAPRVAESWGLDHDAVLALNPNLVYVRMPAFGLSGPWRDRPAFAQTIEPMSGMAAITGFPDGPPTLKGGLPDPVAGSHGTWATIVGLAERERTGRGVAVEAVMFEATVNVCAQPLLESDAYGFVMVRQGNRSAHAMPQGLYECGDGELLGISVTDDVCWDSLVELLGAPELAETGRHGDHDVIDRAISAWTRARSADALATELVGRGIPAAQCRDPRGIDEHPHVVARGSFQTLEHPVLGRHAVPLLPYRFSSTPLSLARPAPTLGQHTSEVLAEQLGLTTAELDTLDAAGITGTRPANL